MHILSEDFDFGNEDIDENMLDDQKEKEDRFNSQLDDLAAMFYDETENESVASELVEISDEVTMINPNKTEATKSASLGSKPAALSEKIKDFNWLTNDDLDNFGERAADDHPFCLYLGSYIYQFLHVGNYPRVYNHLKRLDAKKYHCFLGIFNTHQGTKTGGLHWLLGSIIFPLKTIIIFDSLIGERAYQNYFKNFAVLADMIFFELNMNMDVSEWSFVLASDCCQQDNGYDCGVFACLNMSAIIHNNYEFSQICTDRRAFVRQVIDAPFNAVPIPFSDTGVYTARINLENFPDYSSKPVSQIIQQFHDFLNK